MDEKLTAARELVTSVLTGERTPETDPALFEDDIVYFNVSTLSQHDPGWLEAALRDSGYDAQRRFAVLGQTSLPDPLRLELLEGIAQAMPASLRAETEGFLAFLRSRTEP